MKPVFWVMIIFATEFLQSYFADKRTVELVRRKKWLATIYDIMAESLGWASIVLIVINMSFLLIVSAVCGNALGTYVVANRKRRMKRIYRKKIPFTTV